MKRKRNEELAHSRIDSVLRRMDAHGNGSIEQVHLLKELMEMDRKFRTLESSFGALFSKVISLEKTMASTRNLWEAPNPSKEKQLPL